MRAPPLAINDLEPPDCFSYALNSVNLTIPARTRYRHLSRDGRLLVEPVWSKVRWGDQEEARGRVSVQLAHASVSSCDNGSRKAPCRRLPKMPHRCGWSVPAR